MYRITKNGYIIECDSIGEVKSLIEQKEALSGPFFEPTKKIGGDSDGEVKKTLLTTNEKNIIATEFKSGVPPEIIASNIGRSLSSVKKVVDIYKRNTIVRLPKYPNKYKKFIRGEKENIVKAYISGISAQKIAKEFGRTVYSIRSVISEMKRSIQFDNSVGMGGNNGLRPA